MSSNLKRLFDPIKRGVSSALSPNEILELKIPVGALTDRGNKDLKRIQDALVRHVIVTAPGVPVRSYADYIGDLKPVTPPGVPFPVTLYRFDSVGLPARFQITHSLQGNRYVLRAERIRLACKKKFPKLAAWKASDRARTILVLEDNDIQLTNPQIVAETFLPIAMARNDRPDETYMLMTCTEPWYGWPILIDNMTYFDLAKRHPVHFEIDPAELTTVTAR
jgi:hypothetical protein